MVIGFSKHGDSWADWLVPLIDHWILNLKCSDIIKYNPHWNKKEYCWSTTLACSNHTERMSTLCYPPKGRRSYGQITFEPHGIAYTCYKRNFAKKKYKRFFKIYIYIHYFSNLKIYWKIENPQINSKIMGVLVAWDNGWKSDIKNKLQVPATGRNTSLMQQRWTIGGKLTRALHGRQ